MIAIWFQELLKNLSVWQVIQTGSLFVFAASLVNLLAPPIEWFDNRPDFQKKYKFALLVLSHYASLNFRAALWQKYIDTTQPPGK
jgi:hypothetical protein